MFTSRKNLAFFVLLLIFLLPIFSCTSLKISEKISAVQKPAEQSWLRPGMLNSDRIKAKFGSYGVQVLLKDEISQVRVANLYSEKAGEKILRTLALVKFEPQMDKRLLPVHKEILEGASIGTTLTSHGFSLQKDINFLDEIDHMPNKLGLMMQSDKKYFAALIYNLSAKVDGIMMPYCTIIEIYSPEFLTILELKMIYQGENVPVNPSKLDEKFIKNVSLPQIEENLELVRAILNTL